MYSHGYIGGAEINRGSGDFWEKAQKLNWANDAITVFHGCYTSEFAKDFSKMHNTTAFGQMGSASFSSNARIHIPIDTSTKNVYLYHFEIGNLYNSNGLGSGYYNGIQK